MTMVRQPLCVGLQTCIGQRWNKDDSSDFTVVVEDVEFKCHKFILASCSTFFSQMFRNDTYIAVSNKTVLENISKETFSTIVNAIYLGQFDLTLDNVEKVWQAVDMLDIKYLAEECEDFISDNLTHENFEFFFNKNKYLSQTKVLQSKRSFILKNFEHFKTTETFQRMSLDEVVSLVRDYNLNVSSENSVIDAIMEWMRFKSNFYNVSETINKLNPSKSEDECDEAPKCKKIKITDESDQKDESKPILPPLSTLLSAARLCFLSDDYIKRLLTNPWITSDESALNLVQNAIKCLWKPNCPTSNLVPFRKCHDLCNAVAFISKNKVMFYLLEEKRNVTAYSNPKVRNSFISPVLLAGHQDFLILGRRSFLNTVYEFFSERYSKLVYMVKTRPTHGRSFCLYYQRNFILISNSPDTLYSIEKNPSCTFNVLAVPIAMTHTPMLAIGYKDNIVIFTSENATHTNFVHVVKLDMSSRVESIPFLHSLVNMVSFHSQGNTYVLNGEGDMWLVSESETSLVNLLHIEKLWYKSWNLHGAVCYLDTLLLFGPSGHASLTMAHTSVPNIFDKIEFVTNSYSNLTIPLVVPKRNLSF